MNGNKGARVLNRIFHICFFVCMAVTFIGTLVTGYIYSRTKEIDADGKAYVKTVMYSPKVHILIYGAAILLTVLFCVLYYFSKKDYRKLQSSEKMSAEKKFRIILFTGIGIMLLIQLYFGAELKIHARTDLYQVDVYAKSFAKTGSFQGGRDLISSGKKFYMARYPNNFAIMLILAMLYRVAYLIFGYIPQYAPVALNVLAVNVSLLFTVLIAKQLWGRRKAVYTLCLLFIFAPYYVYVPFYYTDTMSMPFGVIGMYLFILALKTDKSLRVRKYVMLACSGALLFVGFKVKGSIGMIFAAALVYALLKCKLKEFACVALAVVMGFGSFAVMYKVGYNTIGLVTEEQAERYEYPLTHWVMMGLYGRGGWNLKDSNYTHSFETKAEKQEANLKVIKQRVKTLLKNHKLTEHFVTKAVWTWGDGTYFIPGHIKDYVKRSYLHDFVLRDGKYYYTYYGYSNAFQLVLLLLMLLSIFKGIIRPKVDPLVVIKLSVFALFLFLLIWETRSRYLYNFTPFYILMAVDGVSYLTELSGKLKAVIKKKKIGKKTDSEETVSLPEANA